MASTLAVGDQFESIVVLKNTCKQHAIDNLYETRTTHSYVGRRGRYTLKCRDADCPWHLHASVVPDTNLYRIRKLEATHTCHGVNHRGHRQATALLVACKIVDRIRDMPEYRVVDIVKDFVRDHGVTIDYSKAYRAKMIALEQINGSFEDAYRQLPEYCEKLKATNAGSVIALESTEENKFRRVFMSFGAQGTGFVHCRAIIGLDGTHLKSRYKGILLVATTVDARGIDSSQNAQNALMY